MLILQQLEPRKNVTLTRQLYQAPLSTHNTHAHANTFCEKLTKGVLLPAHATTVQTATATTAHEKLRAWREDASPYSAYKRRAVSARYPTKRK